VRMGVCLSEAWVATDKSQNQEWPFAEVSGCASSPVVKQAWRVVCGGARACIPCALARRALCVAATTTSSFFSTGAARCAPPPRLPPPSPPPPRGSARRRSACAVQLLLTHTLRPWPSQAVDCCRMRAALGNWGGACQVANSEVAFCHSFSISCARCCFALLCLLRSVHEANLYRTVSVVRCTWA